MTWDTYIVVDYLKILSSSRGTNVTTAYSLTGYVCALVTKQRAQSLHLMNLLTLRKENDSYTFNIDEVVNQSGPT